MKTALFASVALAALALPSAELAAPYAHTLLISVDGLHALDLANYVTAHPNSALAKLSGHGVTYTNALTPNPSEFLSRHARVGDGRHALFDRHLL